MGFKNSIRLPASLLIISLLTITIPVQAKSLVSATAGSSFSHSLSSDVVIISYSSMPSMLGNPDKTPRIQVFGDARVLIHYPVYMKKAGDYEVYLDQAEIQQLLLACSGILDFDPQAVKQSRKAIKAARVQATGMLYYRSDPMQENFKIKLDSYRKNSGSVSNNIDMSLSWQDIAIDARDYPEIADMQRLNEARQSLRALLLRDDLVKIDSETAAGEAHENFR